MAVAAGGLIFHGDPSRIVAESDDCIEYELEPVQESEIERFRTATLSEATRGVPVTFATRFRWGEFRWLERLGIEMRQILHAEQEYTYDEEIRPGDVPVVRAWLRESRERAGMRFLRFESDHTVGNRKVGGSRTLFVVRPLSDFRDAAGKTSGAQPSGDRP